MLARFSDMPYMLFWKNYEKYITFGRVTIKCNNNLANGVRRRVSFTVVIKVSKKI